MLPSGDGITVATANIMKVGGNRIRSRPSRVHGVAYCDRALQVQATKFPQFWQRKVSFLQARALHRIAGRDFDGAAADIAAADAAAPQADAAHVRSLRLNTRFVEALLATARGDRATGETMAMTAWRQRPYTRQSIYLALAAIGPEGDPAKIETLLRALGQLEPSSSAYVFLWAFENGDFAKALTLVDEVKPRRPIPPSTNDRRANIYAQERLRSLDMMFWIEIYGRKAYALAATGRQDASNALIAELETRLAQATPPAPALPERPSQEQRIRAVVHEQVNLEITTRAPGRLAAWKDLVAARQRITSGHPAASADEYLALAQRSGPTHAIVELVQAAKLDVGPPPWSARDVYTSLGLPSADSASMFESLFDGETTARMTQVFGWMDMFASRSAREHGNCKERLEVPTAHVCDWATDSTMAIAEERALLRAARYIKSNAQGGFIVNAREDIQNSTVATMYGTPIAEHQMGFLSGFTIEGRPAGNASCWRCLDPAAIEASLAPAYAASAPAPSRN